MKSNRAQLYTANHSRFTQRSRQSPAAARLFKILLLNYKDANVKYITFVFIIFASTLCFTCTSNKFLKLCNYSDMTYSIPVGFNPVEVKQNPDLLYQYAIKHKNKKLEIRYSIFPLKDEIEAYNAGLKDKTKNKIVLIDPNLDHELVAISAAMNISRSPITQENNTFKPDAVKQDFNADWVTSYYIENNSEYGGGYQYSLVVAIHKKNIANAFIVFLFDDDKDIRNEMFSSFYNLKFK